MTNPHSAQEDHSTSRTHMALEMFKHTRTQRRKGIRSRTVENGWIETCKASEVSRECVLFDTDMTGTPVGMAKPSMGKAQVEGQAYFWSLWEC